MILLPSWIGCGKRLDADSRARIAAWHALSPAAPDASFETTRSVVIDTETTGLDTGTDRLLAVGAVVLAGLRIPSSETFSAILRQARPSQRDNILIHGVGETAQRTGDDPARALLCLLDFIGKAPLIAFHAPFDESFIRRAILEHLGKRIRLQWIDLATILPVLFGCKAGLSLDEWLARFGIDAPVRHSALGDAFATAQLAQIALRRAQTLGIERVRDLVQLERDARWLRC